MSVRAKICGLSTPDTLDAAIAGGASHVGFVHYHRSARHLPLDRLAELRRQVPDAVEAVAVLVDPDDALLDSLAPVGLDTLQLHQITLDRAAAIRRRWAGGLWIGLPCSSIHDLATAATFAPHADRILFDAPTDVLEVPGGTGRSFDWSLLSEAAPTHPWILSGGLNPANVARAIAATGADFVDVSSGVESAPGVKDVDKIRAFLTACPPMNVAPKNSFSSGPDARGHFGEYGGRYVAETLMPLILELEAAWVAARADPAFQAELDDLLAHYVGRPSPLYYAERLTGFIRESSADGHGAQVWFKRDELNHTGAHKINNCVGQILIARRMGRTRIIAETGAGQHGVATATVAARFGLPCVIYMGARDMERQQPNVFRMKLLGAQVIGVESGARTLKDAMNEAMRDWVANVHDTFYLIGTAAGPHPYPALVRDFQSVIGREAREQMLDRIGRLPDLLVAAIGGGSNAIGLFYPFLEDEGVAMLGVEAAGEGLHAKHAASLTGGSPGVLHGNRTYLLQDDDGQITEAHSISAGLDYPGIGPEHAWLKDIGRVEYTAVTDVQALDAFQLLCRTEGIIPALEPAHAIAAVVERAREMPRDAVVLANLCGRGDKDIFTVAEALGAGL